MKTLITLLLLFVFLPIFSQEMETYKISVQEVTHVKGENKKIELLKNKEENLIIFQNQKEQRLSLNEEDSLRVITLMNIKDKESMDELLSIVERTIQYEVDTIQVQKQNHIIEVTDSFYQNRKKIKQQLEENEDERIILDGTAYTITVTDSKGHSYIYYAHSPTMESHPLIFELISGLLNTCKELQN